jgi:hypothetical protein
MSALVTVIAKLADGIMGKRGRWLLGSETSSAVGVTKTISNLVCRVLRSVNNCF